MLRDIACAAFVGTGLVLASVSAAGANPASSDADRLNRPPSDAASLNPICRPWPPFGTLCTAGLGAGEDGGSAGRVDLEAAGVPEPRIELARGFGCIYTDWAGTGYGVPC
jgi:hypothetical protein